MKKLCYELNVSAKWKDLTDMANGLKHLATLIEQCELPEGYYPEHNFSNHFMKASLKNLNFKTK